MTTAVQSPVDRETAQREVDGNFAAFRKMSFNPSDIGKFALLRNGEVVEIMNDRADAWKLARRLYGDREPYSIQKIGGRLVCIYRAVRYAVH